MKHLKYVLGFGLGIGLVALFLWNTNLPLFWAAIRGARPGYVAAAVALSLLSYVLRSIRWSYLVKPVGKARFSSILEAIIVSFTVSAILPGRLGEVVRPYVLSVRDKLKMSSLFATVVVDRLFDGVGVVTLVGLYLVFGLEPENGNPAMEKYVHGMKVGGLTTVAVLLGGLVFLWLLRWRRELTLRMTEKLLRLLPGRFREKLLAQLGHFADGLNVLADWKALLLATVWSVIIWLEIGWSHYLVIRAFDIHLPFVAMFFLMGLMAIGVSIPTPGGMGGLQWACALGIALVAVPEAPKPAIDAAAMAVWGNSFLPVTVVGIYYLWKEGLSLGKIEEISEHPEGDPPPV